jgi:hypothetical protein
MTAGKQKPTPEDGPEPQGGIVYVPDAERAGYQPAPGEIVIGDAQLAGLARILGPAIERVLAARRADQAERVR